MVTVFLLSALCLGKVPEPVKAIYGVHRFEGKSDGETAKTLKNLGVNAVFIKPDSGLIDALHAEAIKVFVEVPIFAGAAYWRSHPDTRPVNAEGKRIEKREWYAGLCPTNPWLRRTKLKEIERILKRFPIDGLWLDFIRFPCHWEVEDPVFEETCFCPHCLREFQEDTGVLIPEDLGDTRSISAWILKNHGSEWMSWRCAQIAQFVQQAKKIVEKENPGAVLGLFAVPWREEDYNNAIERVVGQDFNELREWVDVFSPMAYHKMCGRPPEWIGEIVDYMRRETGKDVLPIVQASDVSREELREAIRQGLSGESKGVIVLSLEWLQKEERLSVLREMFGS